MPRVNSCLYSFNQSVERKHPGRWGEKIMDSEVNAVITFCTTILSSHPETKCELFEGQTVSYSPLCGAQSMAHSTQLNTFSE